jgi:hypothetical protein
MQRRTFLLQTAALALAEAVEIDVRRQGWTARWIHPPETDSQRYGVFHFRRTVQFAAPPSRCLVHVTADSRYELFVNGRRVVRGPARGDLFHWRYETVDLAPYLRPGRNTVAAVVWNDGPYAAIAQWSHRTGFLMQAADPDHAQLNTGPGWRMAENLAYAVVPVPNYQPTGYYAIGPMERVDAARYPWGWEQPEFDDSAWPEARAGLTASSREQRDAPTRWMLVPRQIPLMEERPERLARLRKIEGATAPADFPARPARVTIPPRSKAQLLLDQNYLTCAFPELEVEGGAGASVTMRYAEALWQQLKPQRMKGHRDEVEGKTFLGYGDTFLADGGRRLYRPLYWRTYRYLLMEIETKDEPLVLLDIRGIATGYPFTVKARFDSPDPLHKQILDVGWRTARLCAHETYMDCPYYEQLQYVGDTRIQALVSVYMSGDARLMRNAIEQIDASRTHEGATFSRAPSTLQQYIPPFSLWWIGMVHDYWRYVDDPGFVKEMLGGVRAVLGFYERFRRADGLLGPMPWWNYVDWVDGWQGGRPPSEPDIMPASIHMQWLLALRYAADLEEALGEKVLAARCRQQAAQLAQDAARFWSPERRLYSEDLAHKHFSQHANVLAVLASLPPDTEAARELMLRVEPGQDMARCSVYFRYYLDRAMVKAGLGERYLGRLGTWEFMLKEGLTTWAERDSPYTRSDCHAWSASPNVEFFRTVLGVDSAGPGWSKVVVKPHLGPLKSLSGAVPHPKGMIEVRVEREGTRYRIDVRAPQGVEVIRESGG